MQAATSPMHQHAASGIRPFDIARDLRPVAELIAEAFANELDQRGNAALREMRVMSHMGGFLKLLNRTTGEFDDVFNGYVWEEEGRVIGNVTVQRADRYGSRWQIANVAVLPSHRGKGIARRLMERALDHIHMAHGRWGVLQVYQANAAARHLYENMGFEYLGGKAELRLEQVPGSAEIAGLDARLPHFYTFGPHQWQELYELANRQLSSQAQWWRALRRSDYQVAMEQQIGEWFGRVIGQRVVHRRCVQITRRFEAALVLTAQRWGGEHEVRLWVRPESYGQYEAGMINWTLQTLADYPRLPVNLELITDHQAALDAAHQAGFQVQRTLLTMRRQLDE